MYANIFAFVLALAAAACGVAAWIISWTSARKVDSSLATSASDLRKAYASINAKLRELESATPTKLAAQVAALEEAVRATNDTHRRFAGRIWQRVGGAAPPSLFEGEWEVKEPSSSTNDLASTMERRQSGSWGALRGGPLTDVDPELAATIALQTAAPVAPGKR